MILFNIHYKRTHSGGHGDFLCTEEIYEQIKQISYKMYMVSMWFVIDGLVQERCNSIANALELRFSCTITLLCCDYVIISGFVRYIHSYPSRLLYWRLLKADDYHHTKSHNLNVSCLSLQLFLCNLLKPVVKSRMKMWLEQRRQGILQLHLSDQQFYCLLRWDLY